MPNVVSSSSHPFDPAQHYFLQTIEVGLRQYEKINGAITSLLLVVGLRQYEKINGAITSLLLVVGLRQYEKINGAITSLLLVVTSNIMIWTGCFIFHQYEYESVHKK